MARERHRRIVLSIAASLLSKFVSVLTNLVLVKLVLRYLGEERCAMWAMISSFLLTLNSADFGIGTGLMTEVAACSGREDRVALKKHLSSGFFMLLFIGATMALIVVMAGMFAPMEKVFNVTSALAKSEAGTVVIVLGIVFGINLPLTVVLRMQEGLQEGFNNYAAQILGNLIAVAFAIAGVVLKLGLPWIVGSLLGGPALATLGMFVFQFWVRSPWARPSWEAFDGGVIRSMIHSGLLYFLMIVLTGFGLQNTDPFIISYVLGAGVSPEKVTAYFIVQRIAQIGLMYWAFAQPLWPAYAEAFARNDFEWIRRMIVRSLKLSILWGLATGAALFLLGRIVIKYWLGATMVSSDISGLLLSFAVYTIMYSLHCTFAVCMTGSQMLKQVLVILAVSTVAAITLKVFFCRWFGVAGVVWASSLSFSIFFIVPAGFLLRKKYWQKNDLARL